MMPNRILQRVAEGEVASVLAHVTLPGQMAARPAGGYSGGSWRKLALGIALASGLDAVLLDEPSSNVRALASLG